MKPVFCNKCHKRIIPPKFVGQVNSAGTIKIKCGDEKCNGYAKIKGNGTI